MASWTRTDVTQQCPVIGVRRRFDTQRSQEPCLIRFSTLPSGICVPQPQENSWRACSCNCADSRRGARQGLSPDACSRRGAVGLWVAPERAFEAVIYDSSRCVLVPTCRAASHRLPRLLLPCLHLGNPLLHVLGGHYLSRDAVLDFTQEDMAHFLRRIVYEVMQQLLLLSARHATAASQTTATLCVSSDGPFARLPRGDCRTCRMLGRVLPPRLAERASGAAGSEGQRRAPRLVAA